MQIKELKEGRMPALMLSGVELFDVGKTFDCGQCFRFDAVTNSKHESEYSGVAFGKFVSFAQDGDTLYIYNASREDFERIWRSFLCLDMNYADINNDILCRSEGTVMGAAMEYGKGIRILRQDSFEALISFIISQNNNIPRIKKTVEALCLRAGQRIELCEDAEKHTSGVSSVCTFPTVRALCELGESGLRELKVGFRAPYINGAAMLLDGKGLDLASVGGLDTDKCIEELCKIKGVGIKVASCAALFGLARYDAFPVDVWMRRVAEKYFPEDKDFSGKRFGDYAGIAQQYLFYYERYNSI